ncbi:Ldl recept a domain containing protein, partial [Asbolus verrucosus]
CRWTEFKCRNGSCIPKSSFCDTINDCGDHFDEPAVCSCKTYLERVHPEKICDGTVNCWDRSDEDPRKTELCISKEMVCDGFKDCPGGDDESTCYSLRTNFSRVDSGEVMRRTAGVWHSGCFTRNHTTSELEEICERLGFAGGSARQLIPPEDMDNVTMMNPVRDRFDVVWIRRARGNKLRLRLRTGNEPYVKFMKDSACHKLFIECL